eukprot:10267187-Karenia_brevis.AAC.1
MPACMSRRSYLPSTTSCWLLGALTQSSNCNRRQKHCSWSTKKPASVHGNVFYAYRIFPWRCNSSAGWLPRNALGLLTTKATRL